MGWKMAESLHKEFPNAYYTHQCLPGCRDYRNRLGSWITILEKPISLKDIEQYL